MCPFCVLFSSYVLLLLYMVTKATKCLLTILMTIHFTWYTNDVKVIRTKFLEQIWKFIEWFYFWKTLPSGDIKCEIFCFCILIDSYKFNLDKTYYHILKINLIKSCCTFMKFIFYGKSTNYRNVFEFL